MVSHREIVVPSGINTMAFVMMQISSWRRVLTAVWAGGIEGYITVLFAHVMQKFI